MREEMVKLAREYSQRHSNGYCSKINDYSFEFILFPKKENEKPKSYVVMKSYFWEKN